MTYQRSDRSGDPIRDLMDVGTNVARESVSTFLRVLDEMSVGARTVTTDPRGQRRVPSHGTARRGSGKRALPASASRRDRSGRTGGSGATSGSGDAPGPEATPIPYQVMDLVYDVASIMTDTAGRLLEIGVGPLQTVIDPELSAPEQTRLVLKAVPPGGKSVGSFVLRNNGQVQADMMLKVINPLGSMTASIPATRVTLDPARVLIRPGRSQVVKVTVQVPANTAAGTYLGIVRAERPAGVMVVLEVDVT
jgi:hypothetical protein